MPKVKPWEHKVSNTAPIIDELREVRKQIKELETREETLSDQVKELGDGEHAGTSPDCIAVVTTTTPERLDTKALKEALPDAMIKKFTKKGKPQRTVKFKKVA